MDDETTGHPAPLHSPAEVARIACISYAQAAGQYEAVEDYMEDLAVCFLRRYQRAGGPALLAAAIQLFKKVSELRPPGHRNCSNSLNDLACAILTRYRRDGGLPDLLEAIKLFSEALTLRPPGHPHRPISLSNLANAILARYERDGGLSDLVKVIELHREALTFFPPGNTIRSISLSSLATAILTRYERDGGRADLVEAIDLRREALNLQSPNHPNRWTFISNFACTKFVQYERDGRPADLLEAIKLHREALSICPRGHPDRPYSLNSLGITILARYERDGGLPDLLEVIDLHSEALNLLLPGHPNRSTFLNSLANALSARYKRDGVFSDLSEVIELHGEALALLPPGHPDRSVSLNNFANAILARYEKCAGQSDVLKVIELHVEALALHPPDHPNRLHSFSNLATAYRLKSSRSQARLELAIAQKYQEEAFDSLPSNNPRWSSITSRLSVDLFQLFELFGVTDWDDTPLTKRIIQLLRNASATKTSPNPDRLHAALLWIGIAGRIDQSSVLEAYRSAFTHLGRALTLGRSLQDRHSNLLSKRMLWGLAPSAAFWALDGISADPKLAVELLDQGRNVLLASVGQFRVDLSDIQREDPTLAEEFRRTSRLLERAILKGQEISEATSLHEDSTSRHQRVFATWETVVAKIRLLPGCGFFLLPVPYIKLQEAAVGGPVVIILVGNKRSKAIIVTVNDKPRVIELPNASREALKALYQELEDAVRMLSDPRRAIRKLPRVLSKLWIILVQPLIEALRDDLCIPLGSRIWWYPTSWASFLPLHAAGSYLKGGTNVPDLYISSYTPTLQALRRARGRPTFPLNTTHGPFIVAQAETPGQLEIPHVTEEVKILSRLVPNVTILSGDQGTKESVLKELRDHSWVHLACHGHPDPKDPFQSHFALHDGPLSLQSIIANDLPSAEFAFLSACHSAAPDRSLPDEGLTLAGGIQFVGFKGVVGTLWAMADEDAPNLAREFYASLTSRSGSGKGLDCTKTAGALHDAMKKLRDEKVPLYRWVNLVHYGV